jgi:hypothetical protein
LRGQGKTRERGDSLVGAGSMREAWRWHREDHGHTVLVKGG